jgi:hypothetical protein
MPRPQSRDGHAGATDAIIASARDTKLDNTVAFHQYNMPILVATLLGRKVTRFPTSRLAFEQGERSRVLTQLCAAQFTTTLERVRFADFFFA